MEIVFTPGQSLVSNVKPVDYSVPVFFHVQCSLAAPTLVNGKFCNCLRTVEMNKNEEYKIPASFCSQTYPLRTSKSDIVSRDSF